MRARTFSFSVERFEPATFLRSSRCCLVRVTGRDSQGIGSSLVKAYLTVFTDNIFIWYKNNMNNKLQLLQCNNRLYLNLPLHRMLLMPKISMTIRIDAEVADDLRTLIRDYCGKPLYLKNSEFVTEAIRLHIKNTEQKLLKSEKGKS